MYLNRSKRGIFLIMYANCRKLTNISKKNFKLKKKNSVISRKTNIYIFNVPMPKIHCVLYTLIAYFKN